MRKLLLIALAFVGALLALVRLLRPREPTRWEDADKPGRVTEVEEPDGGTVGIHHVEQGSGPPVVLIHGFGGHTYTFRYLAPDLSKDHRVVALDLKGFGYSERPAHGDYSLGAQAALVTGLMDQLGIEKASLVGHSMGGAVAMKVASVHPERVARLVLAASVSGDSPPMAPAWLVRPFLPVLARLVSRRLLRMSVYDASTITDEMREAYTRPMAIKGSMRGLYQMLRDARKGAPIDYSRLDQPTLLLNAARERVVPAWMSQRIQRGLPHAEVVTVQRAGHLLLEEQPEACSAAIRDFLTRAPGAATAPPAAEVPAV
jgi:pimeloyl-ACP methyl ester carboxylesterase